MTRQRKFGRLPHLDAQRLASEREELIAAGADPADLLIPLIPAQPRRSRRAPRGPRPGGSRGEQLRQLARVWLLVSVACLGAFAGCVSATGAMLVVNGSMTWHAWVSAAAGLGWATLMVCAAGYAGSLRRRSLDAAPPELEGTES